MCNMSGGDSAMKRINSEDMGVTRGSCRGGVPRRPRTWIKAAEAMEAPLFAGAGVAWASAELLSPSPAEWAPACSNSAS